MHILLLGDNTIRDNDHYNLPYYFTACNFVSCLTGFILCGIWLRVGKGAFFGTKLICTLYVFLKIIRIVKIILITQASPLVDSEVVAYLFLYFLGSHVTRMCALCFHLLLFIA